jgi:hypothetical protein
MPIEYPEAPKLIVLPSKDSDPRIADDLLKT